MKMFGEYMISASREQIWEALRDPQVLAQVIPGAERVEKISDASYEATVKVKIGPISASFDGVVEFSDERKPESWVMSGQGKGGAAGFAKGEARIRLTAQGEATKLSYDVSASVGGKLAQIGQRLIDATAKKMASQFFTAFSEYMAGGVSAKKPAASSDIISNNKLWWALIGAGAALLILLSLFR